MSLFRITVLTLGRAADLSRVMNVLALFDLEIVLISCRPNGEGFSASIDVLADQRRAELFQARLAAQACIASVEIECCDAALRSSP